MATFFLSISLCSVLRFQFIYGKLSQAFFKGRLEVILEFTPNSIDSHIAKEFLVSRDIKNKKSRCVHRIISRSLPRWVDIVAWPVQRQFAYPAKFQKLFNDRGELRRSNLGYSTSFLRNQKQQCRNRVHYLQKFTIYFR